MEDKLILHTPDLIPPDLGVLHCPSAPCIRAETLDTRFLSHCPSHCNVTGNVTDPGTPLEISKIIPNACVYGLPVLHNFGPCPRCVPRQVCGHVTARHLSAGSRTRWGGEIHGFHRFWCFWHAVPLGKQLQKSRKNENFLLTHGYVSENT